MSDLSPLSAQKRTSPGMKLYREYGLAERRSGRSGRNMALILNVLRHERAAPKAKSSM
jgi:hypothetical protein